MKTKRTAFTLSLLVSAIVASTVVLTSTVLAKTRHITFRQRVTIGSTVLDPGIYAVEWTGSGPDVQVSLIKGNKTVATASARLVIEKNRYRRTVETKTLPDDSTVVKRISFSGKSLVFDLPS